MGDYFEHAGLLNAQQIAQTLNYQSQTQKKFGEIITQQGWVNPQTLNWIINLQHHK